MSSSATRPSAFVHDLAGRWRFALDPDDCGLADRWFNRTLDLPIDLPGSLQLQGYGHDVAVDTPWVGTLFDRSWYTDPDAAPYRRPGRIKVPFWLQPRKHYLGPAWYQRDIDIPPSWVGRRITLFLERAHWQTSLWLDDHPLGDCDSLATPHVYDLTALASPGRHCLTIRVDNRMIVEVGLNAHSVSDHTQTAWNGLIGRLELIAGSPIFIDDVQVYPDVESRLARVHVRLANCTARPGAGRLRLSATTPYGRRFRTAPPSFQDIAWTADGADLIIDHPLGPDALLWDEFQPALYHLEVELFDAAATGPFDQRTVTFGLRRFSAEGTRFCINGRTTFLRGTLECCIFPRTGYSPTDRPAWQRLFRIVREHGLNHVRFHSWCPPEAAFQAADEAGLYLQVECGVWANQGATIGDGKPLDTWIYAEAQRILRAYGNHPSFVMMAHGNEPDGPRHQSFLAAFVRYFRGRDPRRLYTAAAGWPADPANQYQNIWEPRIQHWGAGLASRINAHPPETCTDYADWVARFPVPIVSHEIGQWCAFPNFDEIYKYDGLLKPRNFEIFRDRLRAHHLADQAGDFLEASGKLQALCYKEEMESALRTKGFGGFQLLGLQDFPGQGTALVGVLDPFWDSKGYITPSQYRRFCNAVVPLARLSKRTWHTAETFHADLELAHFASAPRRDASVRWSLHALRAGSSDPAGHAEEPLASGLFRLPLVPVGNGISVGRVQADLSSFPAPCKARLHVRLADTGDENDWDFWVYPHTLPSISLDAPPCLLTDSLDAALSALQTGRTVLLLPDPARLHSSVSLGFSSIFWNTSWTNRQPPHTLGLLCDPAHPLFAHFPTDAHTNWQWWELLHAAVPLHLDALPPALRPIVQVIDDWVTCRRLGLLIEARVGPGRLALCSMDLTHELDQRFVARQFRYALLRYLASPYFSPPVTITPDLLCALLANPS